MSSRVKQIILQRVYDQLRSYPLVNRQQIVSHIKLSKQDQTDKGEWVVHLPLTFSKNTEKRYSSVQYNSINLPSELDDVFQNIELNQVKNHCNVTFGVSLQNFIKDILESDPTAINFEPYKKKIIMEYSSPNMAKPFHVGHLRSTIIGNFISNLKSKLGNSVVKINYIGDWGTQMGLLQLGIDLCGFSKETLKEAPVNSLYEAYVKANAEAEKNPEFYAKALEIFQKLEKDDKSLRKSWEEIKKWSIEDLNLTYDRLGVSFDEYHWESSYSLNNIQSILETLELQGVMTVDDLGRKVTLVNGKPVALIKSNGSTLYLMRDIAAAIDRRSRHKFDEMYYIVEEGQRMHFNTLFEICESIQLPQFFGMRHVSFGRVQGMSTRKGTAVFLKDILDEARDLMYEKQLNTETTKVEVNQETADVLGTAAVIVNDLKHNRKSNYKFSWERTLHMGTDSGITLQYAHCRLYSLLQNSGATVAKECDPQVLMEPEAVKLVFEIARFEEVLLECDETLQPSTLVTYLFNLTHASNKAFRVLPIKGSNPHLASQRLLLFNTCRLVLAEGLRIIGVRPLNAM